MRNLFVIAFLNQDNLYCLKIRENLEKNREHIGNIRVKVAQSQKVFTLPQILKCQKLS